MAVLALLSLPASSARAQVGASLDAGAGSGRLSPQEDAAALFVQPGLSLWTTAVELELRGRLARFGGGELTANLDGVAWWAPPWPWGLSLRLGVEGGALWYAHDGMNGAVLGLARLELPTGRGELWVGGGLGAAGEDASWSPLRGLEVGGRVRVSDVTIGISAIGRGFERKLTTLRDSVVHLPPDTTVPVGRFAITERLQQRYADGELRLGWSRGPLALQLAIGGRLAGSLVPDESWARLDGAVGVLPGVTAVFSAGRVPGTPERSLRGQPYYQLGVNLTLPKRSRSARSASPPATPGLQVVEERSGARAIRIRVPGARRVELMGDFSDWRPVEMERSADGVWNLELLIPPGLYRLNMRVDGGEWIVPPGLTPVPDEFNGLVGELVID